jgi:protein-L-isoaspartate(D-aspartate) O-methyltransferase
MGTLPRELFVPEATRPLAYLDEDLALAPGGRRLLAPMNFARLAQLAELTPASIVLDVGCGTGYSTAVLARLCGSVVGLDDDAALVAAANENFTALDIGNAAAVAGDLAKGRAKDAPFDAILIEGAVATEPSDLLSQLKDGGRLAAYLARGPVASACVWTRTGDDFGRVVTFDTSAPGLAAFAPKPQFRF